MVGVIGEPIMNWAMEDDLYMQRRHAVAMEGLEEELEEGEIPPLLNENEEDAQAMINQLNELFPQVPENLPNNPFENGDNFIQLAPELEPQDEEWDMPAPLERQNGVDPFEEAAEEDERRREEWRQRNYEIAKDPNSRWEDINYRWLQDPELARYDWNFPSNKMKEVDKLAFVLQYEFNEHLQNRRLLAPNDGIPLQFQNRFLGIHLQCADCHCCDRHQRNRPEFREVVQEAPEDHQFRRLEKGEKENNCICPCRYIIRTNNRLMNNH